MSDKPRMYQNRSNKTFSNNQIVYNSFDKDNNNTIYESNDIRRKIERIISSNNFIYSKLVHIVIGKEIITKKIIGLYNNNLITIDNEYIPINNIKDIYI